MAAEAASPKLPDVEDQVIEERRIAPGARAWSWLWPKLAAVALFFAVWQVVVWSGWRPDYVLPGPVPVFQRLGQDLAQPGFYNGVGATLRRALIGYSIAVLIGSALGLLVARVPIVRKAVGHAILGLQSMPSIAWFPLAILLFQLTEGEILLSISNQKTLGQQLDVARQFSDAQQLMALMIVIFVVGVAVDLAFGFADRAIRRRWGLAG